MENSESNQQREVDDFIPKENALSIEVSAASPLDLLAATCSKMDTVDERTNSQEADSGTDKAGDNTVVDEPDLCQNADFGLLTTTTSASESHTSDTMAQTNCGPASTATTAATFVLPQYKNVTIDGQEAIFIPITAASGFPLNSRIVFAAPNGSNVGQSGQPSNNLVTAISTPTSITGPSLSSSDHASNSVPVYGSDPSQPLSIQTSQQAVSVQIPVVSPNGKATMQTVQITWQQLMNLIGPSSVDSRAKQQGQQQQQQVFDGSPVTILNIGDNSLTTTPTSIVPKSQDQPQGAGGPRLIKLQCSSAQSTKQTVRPTSTVSMNSLPMILPKNTTLFPATVQSVSTSQIGLQSSKLVLHNDQSHQQHHQQAIIISGNTCQIQQPKQATPIILASGSPAQNICLSSNSALSGTTCQVVTAQPQQIYSLQAGQSIGTINTNGGQVFILQASTASSASSNLVQLQPNLVQQSNQVVCIAAPTDASNSFNTDDLVGTSDEPRTNQAPDTTTSISESNVPVTSNLPTTAYVLSNHSSAGNVQNAGGLTFVPLNWTGSQGATITQQSAQFIPIVRQQSVSKQTVSQPKSAIVVGSPQFQHDQYDSSKWQLIPIAMAPNSQSAQIATTSFSDQSSTSSSFNIIAVQPLNAISNSTTNTTTVRTSLATKSTTPSTTGHRQVQNTSTSAKRQKRVACSCPICKENEGLPIQERKKYHLCNVPGCAKTYGKTSHLRAHLRWHAGDRPFECDYPFCTKRFTRSDELQRHKRTHTGEKRFECSICQKKFIRSDHLSKHRRTHGVTVKEEYGEVMDEDNSEVGTSSLFIIESGGVADVKASMKSLASNTFRK